MSAARTAAVSERFAQSNAKGEPCLRSAPLLDLDPDLGRHLSPEGFAEARRELLVSLAVVKVGVWDVQHLLGADRTHIGLLILDGLVGRELLADDVASLELLGPGDVLRPWDESADVHLLRAAVRWSAFADTRLAIIDRRRANHLARHPEVYTALMERLAARSRRLAVLHAIAQLNRVDQRILTVLWHLAERWGRVTPEGVLLPLTLSHRSLAQLVGARRPTVSTAVGELTRDGRLRRTAGAAWLLTGTPVGDPDGSAERFIAPRRRVLVDATLDEDESGAPMESVRGHAA
jgi:CRP/FNR family cyclic AMP-dependent transcriptional regulator